MKKYFRYLIFGFAGCLIIGIFFFFFSSFIYESGGCDKDEYDLFTKFPQMVDFNPKPNQGGCWDTKIVSFSTNEIYDYYKSKFNENGWTIIFEDKRIDFLEMTATKGNYLFNVGTECKNQECKNDEGIILGVSVRKS